MGFSCTRAGGYLASAPHSAGLQSHAFPLLLFISIYRRF